MTMQVVELLKNQGIPEEEDLDSSANSVFGSRDWIIVYRGFPRRCAYDNPFLASSAFKVAKNLPNLSLICISFKTW